MLDTSDRAVFVSGYDPAMGTTGFAVEVTDSLTVVLPFDDKRRQLCITNSGPATVYLSLTNEVSPEIFTLRLKPKAYMATDNYGGVVTAICDIGLHTELYITSTC